jgi:hypothetical protein
MSSFKRGHLMNGARRLPEAPTISGVSEPYIERCAEPPQPAPAGSSPINMHKAMAGHTGAGPAAMWPNNGQSAPSGLRPLGKPSQRYHGMKHLPGPVPPSANPKKGVQKRLPR